MEMESLSRGDRVHHRSMGSGTVSSVEDGLVRILFDRKSERTGRSMAGVYDAHWFRINGTLLSALPPTPEGVGEMKDDDPWRKRRPGEPYVGGECIIHGTYVGERCPKCPAPPPAREGMK